MLSAGSVESGGRHLLTRLGSGSRGGAVTGSAGVPGAPSTPLLHHGFTLRSLKGSLTYGAFLQLQDPNFYFYLDMVLAVISRDYSRYSGTVFRNLIYVN